MKNHRLSIVRAMTAFLLAAFVLSSLVIVSERPFFRATAQIIQTPPRAAQTSKIYFEENRGQLDERAKFISRGGGTTTFLTATEAVYVLPMPSESSEFRDQRSKIKDQRPKTEDQSAGKAFALRMQFIGANPAAAVSGVGELETKTNYFRGNDSARWLTDVPNFARVRYEGVYAGVDLEFYGNSNNQSQYDFIVAPQADAAQIELDFAGADAVKIDDKTGELLIETAAGTIKQSKPFSYQTTDAATGAKTEIESHFEIAGATKVRFRVGNYDPSKPLVIDPALNNLAFSTFLGGEGDDYGYGIKTDASGNVYVTGHTNSSFFPTTSGTFDTSGFLADAFVTKMSADGSRLMYSTFIGGTGDDFAFSLAVDATGNVYIGGFSNSGDYPTTAGAFDTTFNGNYDAVVTKLNSNGNGLIYSTYIGGTGIDSGWSLAIDPAGAAYLTGETGSTNFPTLNAFDSTFNGGLTDVFVSKLNAGGTSLSYSTFLGGASNDNGYGIAVDSSGNAVITGIAGDNTFPTRVGSFDQTHNGAADAFVTKLNAAGNTLGFSTFLGGSDTDLGVAVTLDAFGNVYVTGSTRGAGFPTANAFDTVHRGLFDMFVTKFTPGGNALVYSTFVGGSSWDEGFAITLDSAGSAYVSGYSESINFPTTTNAYDQFQNGSADAVMIKLNPAGSGLQYSTFFGDSFNQFSRGIALDPANNIYITGYTAGWIYPTDYPITPNAFQPNHAGGQDAFVAKFGNYAVMGRAVDVAGAAVPNATIALSGVSSATRTTDAAGNFIFLDALPQQAYTVSASRSGTVFNPSLFNISNLNNNRNLLFVAGGAPSGGGSGGNLFFSANSYAVNESDNTATVRVWRDPATISNVVSVNYATANGTATAGTDYSAASGVLTFAPGETEKTFTVSISDDVAVEGAETVNLALSNPTGGATLGTSAAVLSIFDNGEPQVQASGFDLNIIASGGVFRGRHIAGIAASTVDGTLYVAADNNFVEPPTGLTNNCGAQPAQNNFDLFKIAPNGTISLLGNYPIPHRALINLEYNASDAMLYTVGTDRKMYRINPATGALVTFNSDIGFDTERYGLESDAAGNLIVMRYGAPNSFYRISAGSGATFLGSYADDAAANFGDRFGIQPDGDYVVFSDAPFARNPREFEIDTTGHTDGTPFNFAYLSTSNVRALGSAFIHSNGAVSPANGDAFTAGGNCAAGSSVILRTPAAGSLSPAASSVFIGGVGNNSTDGAENFNARGVTDLDFGARRNGQSGSCLYFTDDYNDVIYQSCSVAPTAANVTVGGRVTTANGQGISRAQVSLTDPNGNLRTVLTNSFGYFSFDGVPVGETYVFTVRSKRFTFTNPTQVRSITEAADDINFTADAF